MRWTRAVCAFLVAGCVALTARSQDEGEPGEVILETRITLDVDRASVRDVVSFVAKETGMQYMAVDDALDEDPTVSLHIRERPVEEVLEFLEDHLELDIDMGHLRETGVLVIARREPEDEEEEGEEFDPQLDHAEALERIRSHPAVARLLKRMPGLDIELEWDEGDREWDGELRLAGEDVGEVKLAEFDDGRARIVKLEIEIEQEMLEAEPEGRENF